MDGSLENELIAFLNGVNNTPVNIVERFQNLVDLELAQQVLEVRNSLPQQQFSSLKEIKSIQGMSPELFVALLEAMPLQLGWRKNDLPVLLMPVRLETRFKDGALLVRVFPDQIFVDSHDTRLTQTELVAGKFYSDEVAKYDLDDPDYDSDRRNAWRELARSLGPERAAWVNKVFADYDNPNDIPLKDEEQEGWLTAPHLMALPDHFEFHAYQLNEAGEEICVSKRIIGKPIYGDYTLLAGTTSDTGSFFDDKSKWMIDFEEAEERGMAVRITTDNLISDTNLQKGFSRFIASGIRSSSGEGGEQCLNHLIENHHYSEGISFLEYATPTNNTENIQSGYSESTEDIEGSYETEIHGSPNWGALPEEARTNAQRLGQAFGLGLQSPQFRYIERAGDSTDAYAEEMQTALWPVTGDYFLRYLLPGVVTGENLPKLAQHFKAFVRAGGSLPTIRVGEQPFGILPVSSVERWEPSSQDCATGEDDYEFDSQLHDLLVKLRSKWLAWANDSQRVPRVNAPDDPDGDPDKELLKILAMEPTSITYRTRPFMNDAFANLMVAALRNEVFVDLVDRVPDEFLNTPVNTDDPEKPDERAELYLAGEWSRMWENERIHQTEEWNKLTGVDKTRFSKSQLLKLLGWWNDSDLELELVSYKSDKVQETPSTYLDTICRDGASDNEEPKTLLLELLKRSLQLVKLDAPEHPHEDDKEHTHDPASFSVDNILDAICRLTEPEVLYFLNHVTDAEQITRLIKDDAEFGSASPRAYGVRQSLANSMLETRDALPDNKFTSVDQLRAIDGIGEDTLHDILFNYPDQRPTPDFERLFRQTLDLCTHRLDAWISSLATKRLQAMRKTQPSGIYLGAYGYVEDLKPKNDDQQQSEGYIHAPSQAQAKAAAVLHNAYLTHKGSNDQGAATNPFRINLSSERVRRALRVINGVRQGQPLGALLGYQFERALHERRLDKYIDDFREAFPLAVQEGAVINQTSLEAVTARNVVNGLALARWKIDPKRKDIVPGSVVMRKKVAGFLESVEPLEAEVIGLQNSLDAVSDLLNYEGVYQVTQGNYERSGAALDVLSAEGGYPPDIESINVPVTGKNLSHRVSLLLPETDTPQQGPRAKAEPRIAAWFSDMLGELAEKSATFNFLPERININEATLDELAELPGIKKDTAKRIVKYREKESDKNAAFQNLNDLQNIWQGHNDHDEDDDDHNNNERGNDKHLEQLSLLQRWVKTGIDPDEAQYYRPINLNLDSIDEIAMVKDLNKGKAKEIVEHRPIIRLHELTHVHGFKHETLNRIRPWVTTGIVTLNELGINAADLLYLAAVLPHSSDKLNLISESFVDDMLVYESRRINVNQASVNELAEVPGISRGMATKVVKYRDRNGYFSSLDDLSKIWHDKKNHDDDEQDKRGKDNKHGKHDDHEEHKLNATTQLLKRWVVTGNGLHEQQFYQRININIDPIEELVLLAGINKGIAKKIIQHRETKTFSSIDDPRFIALLKDKKQDDEDDENKKRKKKKKDKKVKKDKSDSKEKRIDIDKLRPWITFVTLTKNKFTIQSGELPTEDTEIEQRIKHFVRTEYQLNAELTIDTDIWAKPETTHGHTVYNYSIGESLQLAQKIFMTLGKGDQLQPDFFDLPAIETESVYSEDDVNEIKQRINNALVELCGLIVLLGGEPLQGVDGAPMCSANIEDYAEYEHHHDHDDDDDDEHHHRKNKHKHLDDDYHHNANWGLINALLKAGLFGISGAIPAGLYDPELEAKQQRVRKELTQRAQAALSLLQSVAAPGEINAVDSKSIIAELMKTMKAIFGEAFIVLPTFTSAHSEELSNAFMQDHFATSNQQNRISLWLKQAAIVHPGLAEIEDVLTTSSLWFQSGIKAAEPSLTLHVAQLPFDANSKWLALDDDERGEAINDENNIDSNRGVLSIVAAVGGEFPMQEPAESTRFAGLMIEGWEELIPSDTVDTGVGFHYDAPNTQAPQSLLLAVPGKRSEEAVPWEVTDLLDIIKDTFDLAKVRAVDPDAMAEPEDDTKGLDENGVGLVFPTLMFPVNRENPGWGWGEFINTMNDWTEVLEKKIDACPIGVMTLPDDETNEETKKAALEDKRFATLKVAGEGDWILFIDEQYPLKKYLPGVTATKLNNDQYKVQIQFKGKGTTITKKLFLKNYQVTEYPPDSSDGFSTITVEGELSNSGSGENTQLKLTSETETFNLQGGLVLEAGNLITSKIKVTGHSHKGDSSNELWIDSYDILRVGTSPVAVGVLQKDSEDIYLLDGNNKKWFLDGNYDVATMQTLLGTRIWVKGITGHRKDKEGNLLAANILLTDFDSILPTETISVGVLTEVEEEILLTINDKTWFVDGDYNVDDIKTFLNKKVWLKGIISQRKDDEGKSLGENILLNNTQGGANVGLVLTNETIHLGVSADDQRGLVLKADDKQQWFLDGTYNQTDMLKLLNKTMWVRGEIGHRGTATTPGPANIDVSEFGLILPGEIILSGMCFDDQGELYLQINANEKYYLASSVSVDVIDVREHLGNKIWIKGTTGNRADAEGNNIIISGFGLLRNKDDIVDCPVKQEQPDD